ncbi:hypothetical protein SAMN04489712_101340 [Thermomonospora echinospora]|uniref:PknH-like extracellular domain-containing protein n=2 Tax=Thermomonospora echinospora TaxID=1992 RepID=A0A1H5SSG5_9ACTN|nr:hypothetical protein SAMN04489712_101340 [Thermomonospora echinospora]
MRGGPEPVRRDHDPAGPGEPRPRPGRRGFPPVVLFGAAAVIIVVLVAGIAVLTAGAGEEDTVRRAGGPQASVGRPADSGSSPSSYSSSPSTDAYAGIDQRGEDGSPLTEEEAFPSSARSLTVKEAGSRLKLVGKRLDGDCAHAVWGRAVGDELRRGGCLQAVRGMYADTGRGYALSVTIFNLASSADADRLVDALGRGRGGGFVRPLTGADDGVTVRPTASATAGASALEGFGQGFSMARGLAMGHYAVISWAQRLDGEGDETDEALLALLIEGGKAPAVLGRAAAAG